ncbi:MAG TPA: Bax inhibitor-1/YccA family protein [Acetobacteraceae bacterium]|jgi:FtsH-binding integral membrane protein|nr:Bax inhibitor-1/YccA family protein [Acetobacteraceae bacterium]
MAMSPDYRTYPGATRSAEYAAVMDAGLRAYMLRVYNWMTSGLILTGIVAYAIANTSMIELFWRVQETARGPMHAPTGLAYLAMFAPLAFVLVMSFGVNKLSTTAVQALFWAFCLAMGASLTNIFIIYTQTSIVRVFFVTAATFGAMSLYGYTTRTDLTKMGSFLIMGLFGIIIAMLVNMFVQSSAMQFAISVIGVLIFIGLTAYDTQRIKADYVQYVHAYGPDVAAKRSVFDSLQLLLNFINIFMFLLQLMGNRNSN